MKKSFGGTGHTRGQKILAPMEKPIDLFSIFVVFIHAWYCVHLDPPVDDGTDASNAVYFLLMENQTRKRMMSSVGKKHCQHICKHISPYHIANSYRTVYCEHICEHVSEHIGEHVSEHITPYYIANTYKII